MNELQENKKLISFWDEFFKKVQPMTLKSEDAKVENDLDKYLKLLGDNCERVLDIGCGWGYGLIVAKLLGDKIKYGLGIDPSENGIHILNETCKLSGIEGLVGIAGTHEVLKENEDASFDGIICSNVLDVIPESTSNEVITEISRLLKPGGYFVLKFNFYLTEDLIQKIKMEKIGDNAYAIGGVLRGVNYTLDEWLSKFDGFELVEQSEYERIPNGPKDRVALLRKI